MWKPHDASKMGVLPTVRVGDSKCGRSRVSATESRRATLKSQKPQTKSPKMWWTTIWPSSCILFTRIPRRNGVRVLNFKCPGSPISIKYYRRGQNSSSMVPRTLQIEIKIRQRTHKAILPDRHTQPNPTRVYNYSFSLILAAPRLQTRANTQYSKQRSSNNRSSQPWKPWK